MSTTAVAAERNALLLPMLQPNVTTDNAGTPATLGMRTATTTGRTVASATPPLTTTTAVAAERSALLFPMLHPCAAADSAHTPAMQGIRTATTTGLMAASALPSPTLTTAADAAIRAPKRTTSAEFEDARKLFAIYGVCFLHDFDCPDFPSRIFARLYDVTLLSIFLLS